MADRLDYRATRKGAVVTQSDAPAPAAQIDWPPIDDAQPTEEGGPIARSGFSYQDEIAVGFLLEMIEDASLLKVHCETHDDLILVRAAGSGAERVAEYVQVKAEEPSALDCRHAVREEEVAWQFAL